MTQITQDPYADRNAVLQRVERNANEHSPDFSTVAKAFILDYLRTHGEASGEDITDAARRAGIRPHTDKAFGAILASLSRARAIEKRAYVPRRKGHATAGGILWGVSR